MESGNASGANRPKNMLEQTQAQVNEVVGIMRVNVEKVLERDQKLSELDSRADALQEGGKRFEQQAQKLKRKYWWKNLKMMIILGVVGLVILIIIIMSLLPNSSSETTEVASKPVTETSSTPGQ
ncbi:synaptobrevin-1 isoform X1 [Coccinella septempunctata]|uniref:synaptobrevin-1 isoform X1 n=1 Tax=Coccinella septempunctata TaxID=41139 RepID=UPI001D064FFD|nr:synaptobrevin-1 isoform X1 [Coccinella septempunctata]